MLVSRVKIREKLLGVCEDISLDIHESPVSQFKAVVLLDVSRETGIYQSKDIKKYEVFSDWAHLFVSRKGLVKVVDAFILSTNIV